MKRSIFIATIFIISIFATCKKVKTPEPEGPTPTPELPKPDSPKPDLTIDSISPSSGKTGDTITVIGAGFGTDTLLIWVDFNGSRVHPKEISETKLKALVPEEAMSGKIRVSKDTVDAFSETSFTVIGLDSNATFINTFSPVSARPGDSIAIKGGGFGIDTNAVSIRFGNSASVRPKDISDTTITVIVPEDAETAEISLSVNEGEMVVSGETFTLLPKLTITTFMPESAKEGQTVLIDGTGFGADTNAVRIKFGNSEPIKPEFVEDKRISVIVPKDAETGKISVSVNEGEMVVSGETFTLLTKLTITTFVPESAKEGQTVFIDGTGFGTDTNAVRVKFGNSEPIKPKSVRDESISVIVPKDAETGKISVYVNETAKAISSEAFTLVPTLRITNFEPQAAAGGDTLTINGTGFTNVDDVWISFNNAPGSGTRAFYVTETQIKFVVHPYTVVKSAPLEVSVNYGTERAWSTQLFTLIPTISIRGTGRIRDQGDNSILSARAGEIIDLCAGIMDDDPNRYNIDDYYVKFAGTGALKPKEVFDEERSSITRLRIRIPADAKDGKIEVGKKGYRSSVSDDSFTILPQMPEVQAGVWTERASFRFLEGLSTGSVAFTIGKKGYVACGESIFEKANSVWEYDPSYNAWMQKAAFAGGNRAYAASFSINNKGYICTGNSDNDIKTTDLWEFDPDKNTWVQKADFPGSARAYATAFTIGNKGYVGAGNSDNSTHFDDFYQYDPIGNKWNKITSVPGARSEAFAFVVGNKAYVGNGYSGANGGTPMSDMYMYDPEINSWTGKATFPTTSYVAANNAFSVKNKGYVGLGYNPTQAGIRLSTNEFYEYSPASNSWMQLPVSPFNMFRGVAFSIDDIGYVGLGVTWGGEAGSVKKEFWAYKP